MTGINYLDEVWNVCTGCSGKGCKVRDHCWAKGMVKRFSQVHDNGHDRPFSPFPHVVPFNKVQFHPDRLEKPLHWKKPRRVGVCFCGDLFDDQVVSMGQNEGERIWQIAEVMLKANWHKYFVLTKQVNNMVDWHTDWIKSKDNTDHIYWGVSITDQEDLDWMGPELLKIPGKHWVSIEPYLEGWIDIEWALPHLSWVVLGCESGPHRRPCPLEWMIDVVGQCKAAGVPVWVKQIRMGKVYHDIEKFPKELQVREYPV